MLKKQTADYLSVRDLIHLNIVNLSALEAVKKIKMKFR